MSGNLENFTIDWNSVTESDFKVLPSGTYAGKITASSVKETNNKAGTGVRLEITLLGAKGVQGRKVFEYCLLTHTNKTAADIGRQKLKALGEAIDLSFDQISDTSELHGKPFGVVLKVENSDKYGEQNKVKAFVPFSEELLSVTASGESVSGF